MLKQAFQVVSSSYAIRETSNMKQHEALQVKPHHDNFKSWMAKLNMQKQPSGFQSFCELTFVWVLGSNELYYDI